MREKFRELTEILTNQESKLFAIEGLKIFLVNERDKATRGHKVLVKEYKEEVEKLERVLEQGFALEYKKLAVKIKN